MFISNKGRHLRAAGRAYSSEKEVKVLVQRLEKGPRRIGIQSTDNNIDEIRVGLAAVGQVRRVWVHGVAVNCAVVCTGRYRMRRKYRPNSISNSTQCPRDVGAEEICRHAAVLEEPPRHR